jgi:hypothetical protein
VTNTARYEEIAEAVKESLGADAVALVVKGGSMGNAIVLRCQQRHAHEMIRALGLLLGQLEEMTLDTAVGGTNERLVAIAALGKQRGDA